jgi:hypothetical protein
MRVRFALSLFSLLAVAACSGEVNSRPPFTPAPAPTIVPETAAQTDRQRPPADVAPVSAPAAGDALHAGLEVPFKVCSQRTGWQKPAVTEMTQVLSDRRFGDGVSPDPSNYTYYLRPFYFPTVFSASANKYLTAFGGF